MKKALFCLLPIIMITGCGKLQYETGMYTDVREWDFYEEAVRVCVNEGYIAPEGDSFGAYEPVTLSECADIIARMKDSKEKNSIEYVLKNDIAYEDFGEWDAPATREQAAYMLAKSIEHDYINPVADGAITDAEDSFAKDEIYALYKMGIFSGDKDSLTFRPHDYMVRAEMAIVIDRCINGEKRIKFDMGRSEVSFVAFGDTIGHMPVINSGKSESGYDFTGLFENVKEYIENADVACVNQETIFVQSGFSGYPAFGSPCEIGKAEREAGFDVVTHATNHAFDRGIGGILYTASFWDNYSDIIMLGIHQDEDDAGKIDVIEKNGIKIALLNYTYALNGYTLPNGKGYLVDILDEDKIKNDMERAKEISDAVVVFAHWGNEYQNIPSESQRKWAQLFADCGAVAVVGHHPHVVQPLEYVTSKEGRVVPVYYSLGNFISNQSDYQNALCGMADFSIVKDVRGVRAERAKIEAVITHMEANCYSAYLLKDYPEDKLLRHKHRGKYQNRFTREAYREVFNSITE